MQSEKEPVIWQENIDPVFGQELYLSVSSLVSLSNITFIGSQADNRRGLQDGRQIPLVTWNNPHSYWDCRQILPQAESGDDRKDL